MSGPFKIGDLVTWRSPDSGVTVTGVVFDVLFEDDQPHYQAVLLDSPDTRDQRGSTFYADASGYTQAQSLPALLATRPTVRPERTLKLGTHADGTRYVDSERRGRGADVQVFDGPGQGRRGRIVQPQVHADGWVGVLLNGDPSGAVHPFDPARLAWTVDAPGDWR